MDDSQYVVLEITTYIGSSIGAMHFYGVLVGYVGNDRKRVELFSVLSQRDATRMNNQTGTAYFKAGTRYHGFNTGDEIITQALETYKQHFPQAIVLILGRRAFAEPQEVLDGPEDFKTTVNAWFEEAERIGWYDNNHRRMEQISDAYSDYLMQYRG